MGGAFHLPGNVSPVQVIPPAAIAANMLTRSRTPCIKRLTPAPSKVSDQNGEFHTGEGMLSIAGYRKQASRFAKLALQKRWRACLGLRLATSPLAGGTGRAQLETQNSFALTIRN